MLKFMVVVYKLPTMSEAEFVRYFREVHGALALKLPRLKKCRQNFVADDPLRKHPGWNAIMELYWENREAMEAAWRSPPEGSAATTDLPAFADLTRTAWSIVEEHAVLG